MSPLEVRILMKLQYEFSVTARDPYYEAAYSLGLDEDELLEGLNALSGAGVLKRVGFYVNYRSQGHEAALVAFSSPDPEAVGAAVANDELVTHAYLRDDPDYNVWVVVKRASLGELVRAAEEILRASSSRGFIVLRSARTYKLSVKFDLERGISRSGPYSTIVQNPRGLGDLGVPPEVPRALARMPISRNPYAGIASRLGLDEGTLISLIPGLLKAGVLADPGAAIDGEAAGFRFNGMVLLEPEGPAESLCEVASKYPYTTHVVLREPYPPQAWRYPCYAMIHAVRRDLVDQAASELASLAGARGYRVLYSLGDLKPRVVR
ncbi:MAG: Lrp/AsnC family transcriptional regulator [Acidilobus sp.]